ncbi:MAG: hypothetical protein V3T83_00830 [Acidobacteriota bacterium]
MEQDELVEQLDQTLHQIVEGWYQRVKGSYVTVEENQELGVEPEIKRFHEGRKHRIKFAREQELDVTYGLETVARNDGVYVDASVNNKSSGFDYDSFVKRLQDYYWRSRNEKPFLRPGPDRYAYQDLLPFDPIMGHSVLLDLHAARADIIRLLFRVSDRCAALLPEHKDLFRDLIENYCLSPMKMVYAETYRESS